MAETAMYENGTIMDDLLGGFAEEPKQILSAYIVKSYGQKEGFLVNFHMTEKPEGKSISAFCDNMGPWIKGNDKTPFTSRDKLVIKYRMMRQMLYALRDFHYYCQEQFFNTCLSFEVGHFCVCPGDTWKDFRVKLVQFDTSAKSIAQSLRSLGRVFLELLEERSDLPKNNETLTFSKHRGDMDEKEAEALKELLLNMEHGKSVEEIIQQLSRLVNQWIQKQEVSWLESSEFLKKEEISFIHTPYSKVGLEVSVEGCIKFYQFYEVPQNGLIPLICGSNLPYVDEADSKKRVGYLYESDGRVYLLLLDTGESVILLEKKEISLDGLHLKVCALMKENYANQRRTITDDDDDI